MSEGADSRQNRESPGDTVPTKTGFLGTSRWPAFRRGLKELLIVFFGVYAAFLLNRFDSDRRDAQRRSQLLEALEREWTANVDELKTDVAQAEIQFGKFDAQLTKGEMPPLSIASVNTGYSSSDDATLLQAGGLELLDIQTLDLLRKVNGMERSLIGLTRDQFQLSLVMLANREQSEFYDPATRKLKPHYAWYPDSQHGELTSAKALLASEEELLAAIRARRKPGAGPGQK